MLARRNVGEADTLGQLLFSTGLQREVRSHGLRKSKSRSGLLLEPGSLVQLTYYENEKTTGEVAIVASLKEGHVIERYAALKDGGYDGLLLLSYFLELARFGAKAGESTELFLLLKGTLEALAELCADNAAPVRSARFLLLSVFFKVRVLKILGLVGDARTCAECGSELGDEAIWGVPEVFFTCDRCAVDVNRADAYAARAIAAASEMRFGRFAEYLADWPAGTTPQDGQLAQTDELPEWLLHIESRLLQCMEHYQGGPLRAATQLREHAGLSA